MERCECGGDATQLVQHTGYSLLVLYSDLYCVAISSPTTKSRGGAPSYASPPPGRFRGVDERARLCVWPLLARSQLPFECQRKRRAQRIDAPRRQQPVATTDTAAAAAAASADLPRSRRGTAADDAEWAAAAAEDPTVLTQPRPRTEPDVSAITSTSVGSGGGGGGGTAGAICVVCFDRPADAVIYRCGHQCACLQCAYYMHHSRLGCPLCRAPIEDVIRVYK